MVYKLNFMRTVELFDRLGIGMLKAWWAGSRDLNHGRFNRTWSMFRGDSHALGPERKYVTDVMCRVRPIAIAGVTHTYHFDFATRFFQMEFTAGQASAPTEIYLPLERWYPDGLRIRFQGLEFIVQPDGSLDADGLQWDRETQRLLVHYPFALDKRCQLEIVPGTQD